MGHHLVWCRNIGRGIISSDQVDQVPGSQVPPRTQRTAFVSPSCANLDPDDDELVDELDEGEVQFGRHFLEPEVVI